jgi:hypothetical protein
MSAAVHLGTYAEGWTKGDTEMILNSVSDDYTFDDPNAGNIAKGAFAEYLSRMKQTVRSLRGGKLPEPFMELSEVVTRQDEELLTAWCWWVVPGTDLRGSGLIKVGPEGVRSEVVAYYTKLPA